MKLKRMKLKKLFRKQVIALLMLAILLVSVGGGTLTNFLIALKQNANTTNNIYRIKADPNTMDTYQDSLINEKNGSRYAGRVWADKTVLANGSNNTLSLDMNTDGIDKKIEFNDDFLHVYSALGSTINEKREEPVPVDVVFIIDMSGSMCYDVIDKESHGDSETRFAHSRIQPVITSVNNSIDYLMEKGEENRVSVVVYGGTAYTLMDLGHYKKNGESPYITVSDFTGYNSENEFSKSGSCAYTLTANATKDGVPVTRSVRNNYAKNVPQAKKDNLDAIIGFSTNLQAGIYQGFNELYENMQSVSDVTYTYSSNLVNEKITVPRVPVAVVMSDGATNYALKRNDNNASIGDEWYNVQVQDNLDDIAGNYKMYRTETNGNGGKETILETLLTAGFMKAKVSKQYNNLIKQSSIDRSKYNIKFNVVTVSVDTPEDTGNSSWQPPRLYATLNPKKYFKKDLSDVDWTLKSDVEDAYTLYEEWLAAPDFITSTFNDSDFNSTQKSTTIKINKIIGNVDGVTNEDVVENINYTDSFDDVTSGEVDNFFKKIVTNITDTTFMPVGGSNEHGVGDSITYMDPIGKYLEVKENGLTIDDNNYDMSLLLFGKMHNMQKNAMYSYTFNLSHGDKTGWYSSSGDFLGQSGNWSNGDTYYLSNEDVKKAIPTLTGNKEITNQQKNTVYTIYGFVGEDANEEYSNLSYDDSDIKYKLNDIRVWTEYTGNFVDEDNPIAPELGYDNALYVNIPITALPLQSVTVEKNLDGKIRSYKSNIDEKTKSTPIRLFYSVGIKDEILTEDKLDIDLAKVSHEYLAENKKNDIVYFYSNYYSKTNYNGYVTDTRQERTRGDANVTFSPDKSNRYYAFQRSLALYEISSSDVKNKDGFYDEINIDSEEAFKNFEKNHNVVSSSDKIKADSWYYIVIDYYLPGRDTMMRTAIAREGKEFGLGEDSVSVNVENQLCWYSNSTGESKTFTLSSSKPEGEDWVIATKPGGLRVGDMAQSLRSKTENTTETAANYIIPVIASNADDKIIIDAFLGNNGRIEVSDSLLLVGKEIATDDALGEETYDRDKEFEFTLKVDNHEGDYQAIKIHKNPYSNAWQLRLSTIDLLTDNSGFLQGTNNKLYVYKENGQDYYVYIGDNTEVGDTGGKYVFRVYSAVDNDNKVTLKRSGMTTYVEDPEEIETSLKSDKNKYKKAGGKNSIGSIDFWVNKVYLVPVKDVEEGRFEKEATSGYKAIDEFVVAHLDSMKEGANELSSDYATETAYLTTEIKFGYSSTKKPATRPDNWTEDEWENQEQNVAKVKIKADEGILLTGLRASTKYQITEELTEEENKERYYFDHIEVNEEAKAEIKERTVKGTVVANYIDEIVYTNKYYGPVELTIGKSVEGLSSNKETEWHFDIKLTPREGIVLKEEYSYTAENNDSVEEKESGKVHLEKQEDGSYEGTVGLKHGQRITIHDIPEYTKYVVKEKEANSEGYTTEITGKTEGTLDVNNPKATIDFKNVKYSKYKLSISKEIEGEAADRDKEWTFEVRLKHASDTTIEDSYTYSGSKSGTIKFSEGENGEYVGEVKLKAGETVTIEDIVERTEYSVEEKESNKDGYITLSENNTGVLKDKETEKVKFKNIKYSLHDLTIEKKVTGGAGEKERTWEFEINLTPEDDVIFDTNYPIVGGTSVEGVEKAADGVLKLTKEGKVYKGTIKLKHGQKITIKNIPERTQYSVVEKEANTDEYKTTVTGNEEGTLKSAEEKVVFTNRKLSKHSLTITKEVEGALADKDKNWQFKVTLTPNGESELIKSYQYEGSKNGSVALEENGDGSYSGTITLKHGETITIKNIPEGTKYKVEEIEANSDGYTTIVSSNSEGTLGQDNPEPKVKFSNIKLSKHSLSVSKEVTGGAGDKEKEWNFVITLKPREGITLLDSYPIVGRSISEAIPSITEKEVKLKHNSDGTSEINIKLRHGQSIIINDLPEETEYKIEEKEANKDGYITIVEGKVTGKLGEKETDQVKFINKKPSKSDLTITKEVRGGLGDKNKLWTFNVILTPDEYVTLANKYTVEGIAEKSITVEKQSDGSYKGTIKLKSGEKATIKDLPEKTKYKIEEEEANEDGYITTIKGQEGTLNETKQSVEFTNTKLASYDLTIRKKVYGNLGDKEKEWNFKIKLYAPEIKDLQGSYDYEKKEIGETEEEKIEKGSKKLQKVDDHYEVEITLKDNEEITIKEILEDTKYEIIEKEANTEGYETTIEGTASGILNAETGVVTFKNVNYSKHDLKVDGKLKGNSTDPNKEWTLDVTIKPDPNANFKDSYVWEDENGEEHLLELTPNGDGTYSGQLKLKGEESGTIKDLPYGSEYEIKIEEANKDGYKTTYELEHGVLNSDMEAKFINERNIKSPKTFDNIMTQFTIFILSIVSIILTGVCFKIKRVD